MSSSAATTATFDLFWACSAGENVLKNTGLGYTVIRAGPLLEEPGGYKALIFDQVPAH